MRRDFSKVSEVENAMHFKGKVSKDVNGSLESAGNSQLGSCLFQLDCSPWEHRAVSSGIPQLSRPGPEARSDVIQRHFLAWSSTRPG